MKIIFSNKKRKTFEVLFMCLVAIIFPINYTLPTTNKKASKGISHFFFSFKEKKVVFFKLSLHQQKENLSSIMYKNEFVNKL